MKVEECKKVDVCQTLTNVLRLLENVSITGKDANAMAVCIQSINLVRIQIQNELDDRASQPVSAVD